MKKYVALLMSLALLFALIGCGEDTTATSSVASSKAKASSTVEVSKNADSEEEASVVASSKAATASTVSTASTASTASTVSTTSTASTATVSVPTKNEYKKATYSFAQITDYVHVTGRTAVTTPLSVSKEQGLLYDHAGQGLIFTADCEGDVSLTLAIKTGTETGKDYLHFSVRVDGTATDVTVQGGAEAIRTMQVATGLKRGTHRFEIYRCNEPLAGVCTLMTLTMNGTPKKYVAETGKTRILFIGDSITAGTGVLGVNKAQDEKHLKYNNATLSYAFRCGEILNADFSIVARSGMTASLEAADCVYHYYDYLSYERSHTVKYDSAANEDVDVIVVSLGANDTNSAHNFSDELLTSNNTALLQRLRKDHPNAKIIWAYGQLTKAKANVLKAVVDNLGGSAKGFYFYAFTQNNTAGSSYHPNKAAQEKDAQELATYIKGIL